MKPLEIIVKLFKEDFNCTSPYCRAIKKLLINEKSKNITKSK